MYRNEARQMIKANWKSLFKPDRKNKGIICPICGSGSGRNGTGITENPKKPGQLTCWNCGFKGDVIDLIMKTSGKGYSEAMEEAAAVLGINIDQQRPDAQRGAESATQDAERESRRKEAKNPQEKAQAATGGNFYGTRGEIPAKRGKERTEARTGAAYKEIAADRQNDYTQYYCECECNLSDPAALAYLQARGISPETAAVYGLGYDPAWISPTVIMNQRAKGKDWRPEPTQRIIIPITGNHYIARAISPDIKKEFAKMNETGGGKTGIFNAGAVYDDHESVFVTEGVFDALSIIETGAAALALNSTSNTGLLLEQLERDATRATLILCLDSDEAGKKAADELKKGFTRLNISYVSADINGGYKDPNEALTGNRAAFVQAIRDAQTQAAARPDNMRDYIDNLMQGEIERMRAAADLKTGFTYLDAKSGGLYPGLYVIAATSSLGKTTFTLQLADSIAAAGHDVLFFSLEQSRLELISKSFARILAQSDQREKVSSLALRKGYCPKKLQAAAKVYKDTIADNLSIIEGNFNCNISFIGDYIRRYIKRNHTSPIVIIDYLQILQPAEDVRTMSAKETVDSTVTELKRISREHDLTVFVVSSVNRANYITPIDFEALKESGGIEYTADVIWGLQLQCLNEPLFEAANKIKEKRQRIREAKAEEPRKIELLCLKNRYGIANFSCEFDYYPVIDLYVQGDKEGFCNYYKDDPVKGEPAAAGHGNNQPITAVF